MSGSLLRAVKLFVVLGGVLIIVGTATLIALLVKRGTQPALVPPPAETSVALPQGAEIAQAAVAGRDLVLLGRSPQGQFVLLVDMATGARRRLIWLAAAGP